jgi:hypothetical protein
MQRNDLHWALVGTCVALVLLGLTMFSSRDVAAYFELRHAIRSVIVVLWPSSFIIMATYGIERTATGIVVMFIAVLFNALVYVIFGRIVSLLLRLATR